MNHDLAALYAAHYEALVARHVQALEAGGFQALVIFSGLPQYQFLDDRPYPFVANPQFRSWVPLPHHEGGAIVVTADGSTRLVYMKPRDFWHAPPATPDPQWARHFDLRVVAGPDEIAAALGIPAGRVAVVSDRSVPEAVASAGELNPQALIDRLHYARARKTPYEVACMRRANAIAVRGHRAAEHAFRDGASEFEIHVEYCRACGQDARELPYDNIVALDEHGAILHYTDRSQRRGDHRSFLIDAGASYNGYAADITRTYSATDDEFAQLIAEMNEMQLAICAEARAGADFVELHTATHARLARVLARSGIVRCEAEAALERGITRAFFPHGLGHYIGVQVHDVGGHQVSATGATRPPPEEHPFLRLTRKLEPGVVCTIEPGLYFIDMLLDELRESDASRDVDWARVERLQPYGGIRIEDDVHVTAAGHENLTREEFRRHA